MQADTIELTCQCGRTLAVPASAMGKTAQCPACGHQWQIPTTQGPKQPTSITMQPEDSAFDLVSSSSIVQAMTNNPYAPVGGSPEQVVPVSDDAEAMRRYYLPHETSVKSLGLLFIVGGFVTMLAGINLLAPLIAAQARRVDVHLVIALAVMLFGTIQFVIGFGLRKLNATARIVGVFLCAISILNVPVGSIISVYFLYLLLSKKGQMIFRPEYKEIIAMTPDVRYRTPGYIWVVAALIVLLTVLFFVGLTVS